MGQSKSESIKSQLTPWLVVSILVSSMCNSTLNGFNTAVLNTPSQVMFEHYNQTFCERGKCLETEADWDFLPIAMIIFVAGGMVGAFITGVIANKFGRKNSLWYHEFVVLVGSILSAASWWVPELLYVGRVFIGIACGISVCLVSTYLAEIAPRKIRGVIGCFHQIGVVTGIVVAQVLGLPALLGNSMWWLLVGFPAIPAAISIVVLKFCPESPRFLYLNRHDREAARAALKKLRRTEEQIEADLHEYAVEQEITGHMTKHISMRQLLTRKEFRMALTIACMLQVTQQLSGINAMFAFSGSIFKKAGVNEVQMPYAVLATGVVNLIFTLISTALMEKCGRRPLLIWPMCLMAASMLVIIFSIHFQAAAPWLAYVSIGCIITFIMGFAPGLGPIPGLLPNELFRQEARSTAVALALAIQWGSSLLLNAVFKYLLDTVREFVFAGFLTILVAGIIFFYIFMPETKHKTFQQIQESLAFGRRLHKKHCLSSQPAEVATDENEKDEAQCSRQVDDAQLTSLRIDDPACDTQHDNPRAHLVLSTETIA